MTLSRFLAIVAVVAAAAIIPLESFLSANSSTIDAGPFTVAAPRGTGWEIERVEDGVSFTKSQKGPAPRLVTGRHIRIRRNFPPKEKENFSAEQIADDYRYQEESGMVVMGVLPGHYDLQNLKKGVTTRGEKRLYYMSYRTVERNAARHSQIIQEAVLYLYFPERFSEDHFFYMFLSSEACLTDEVEQCGAFDTTEIFPFIDSLHIK